MLTLPTLEKRLRDWSKSVENVLRAPRTEALAIVYYQLLFGLVHDLKSSVQLTSDPAVSALTPLVLRTEAHLRKLSANEIELDEQGVTELLKLIQDIRNVESIEAFLNGAMPRSHGGLTPPQGITDIYRLKYPWETLSKARAAHCLRYGYVFFEHATRRELFGLSDFDSELQVILTKTSGVAIVRELTPAKGVSDDPTKLILDVRQLAAFPRKACLGDEWAPVDV